MKPQPFKKALKHLEKAENFQERLSEHMKEVREYIEKADKYYNSHPKPKKKK